MSNDIVTPGDELDLGHYSEIESDGPVECLGKTFENDQARREYYLGLLAEKLKDPEFRKIEGFPIGEDEDILELSDPPYYTACPNPFIEEFISFYGHPYEPSESYKREPYAADVSEGKNDPIYNAHSYHTKVPHKAIMRYILHYTNPGDLVFDGFCGTGMTGVAAQMCGDKKVVESLGYRVLPDGNILQKKNDSWIEFSKLGVRMVVLNDLSPVASLVAKNFNQPVDHTDLSRNLLRNITSIDSNIAWVYSTLHNPSDEELKIASSLLNENRMAELIKVSSYAKINYMVWSDVFSCSECDNEIIFWDAALDFENGGFRDEMICKSCSSSMTKKSMNRVFSSVLDEVTGQVVLIKKEVPVLVNYSYLGKRYEKSPDDFDFMIIDKVQHKKIDHWVPTNVIPVGDKTGEPKRVKMEKVHQFYTHRNLLVLSELRAMARDEYSSQNLFVFTSTHQFVNKMCRLNVSNYFSGKGGKVDKPLDGTLYVPSISLELNVLDKWKLRSKLDKSLVAKTKSSITSCGSAAAVGLSENSLDYIFLDPPFGSNLMYSELNYLWESWIGVVTNNEKEAIENKTQGKNIDLYRGLIQSCLEEAYRALKPGRWLTVEFSNTKSAVWNSIQSALSEAGFIVSNVSMIDKKKGSFKSVTNTMSVKQDLIISAYKPNGGFENRFVDESDEEGLWDFVRTHLGYLPVVKKQSNELVKIPERDQRILFDQVVAYFVRNLRDVPISSKEFQVGLAERFAERDGMIFLPEQVIEYDKARMSSSQLKQLTIFVDDEASAIEWLRQRLNEKTQTYQDIQPKFINELSGWKKSEKQLELSKLLEQNFLKYEGIGPLPPQIHSYLSSNFKEMRNLPNDDPQLIKKAKDRFYVPNPDREEDLQKLRDRDLLKQFDEYKNYEGRKLKTVRMEAVRCGFKKSWKERDYSTIIQVAEKIPQNLLQEDQKLLMWYDQAQTRNSDESLF